MKKLIVSLFAFFILMGYAFCAGVDTSGANWGWPGGVYNGDTGNADSFRKITGIGTYGDEKAVVGMVAREINAHGGYFCPDQIQCCNENNKHNVWTRHYEPAGFDASKHCFWLCIKGYSGTGCKKIDKSSPPKPVPFSGWPSGISLNINSSAVNIENKIKAFKSGYATNRGGPLEHVSEAEYDTILGVIEWISNGAVVAPVEIWCQGDWACNFNNPNCGSDQEIVSEVRSTARYGTKVTLCAEGYTPNSDETACVTYASENGNTNASGSDNTSNNSSSTTDSSIPLCPTTPTSGLDGRGTCISCEIGQYFDTATKTCKKARAFSKTDLMYGIGETKNTISGKVSEQCWTKLDPTEYKKCVLENANHHVPYGPIGDMSMATKVDISHIINGPNSPGSGTGHNSPETSRMTCTVYASKERVATMPNGSATYVNSSTTGTGLNIDMIDTPEMPNSGATNVNSSTTGTDFNIDIIDTPEQIWHATCTKNGTSTSVTGAAQCFSQGGDTLFKKQEHVSQDMQHGDNNKYCWCKIKKPAHPYWVFVKGEDSSAACLSDCKNKCTAKIVQAGTEGDNFRTALFSTQ